MNEDVSNDPFVLGSMVNDRIPIIEELFLLLRDKYGHPFNMLYKTPEKWKEVCIYWAKELRLAPIYKIKNSIEAIAKNPPIKAPTLPRFKRMCRSILSDLK